MGHDLIWVGNTLQPRVLVFFIIGLIIVWTVTAAALIIYLVGGKFEE